MEQLQEKNVLKTLQERGVSDPANLERIYEFSPVYLFEFRGKKYVLKQSKDDPGEREKLFEWERLLNQSGIQVVEPVEFSSKVEDEWVVYPFYEGTSYTGSSVQTIASAKMLGNIHRLQTDLQLNEYSWPDSTQESVQEDIQAVKELEEKFGLRVPDEIIEWLEEHKEREAKLKSLILPCSNGTWDYKGNNLIFAKDGSCTLIDPDNAGYLPRIFDLALTLVLFNNENDFGLNRVWNAEEWQLFIQNYSKESSLSQVEKDNWCEALKYMYVEEAVWALLDNDEKAWNSKNQGGFLKSLLTFPSVIANYSVEDVKES